MRQSQAQLLRRLATLVPTGGHILSVYLDLDPADVPNGAARRTLVESVIDAAKRRLRDGEFGHLKAATLEPDLARVREWMGGPAPGERCRGVAVFSAAADGIFEAFTLHRPVPTEVHVGSRAVVEPLIEALAPDAWCVLLVNRRTARIFRGDRDRLAPAREVLDDVPGRADQGGWSQARYRRHIDEHAKGHVRHACDAVFRELQRSPFDVLAVAAPEETWPAVDSSLHPDVRGLVAGRIEVDVEHSSPAEVLDAARDLFDEHERDRERVLLDRLSNGLAHGAAVSGLEPVLDELAARRVETLVLGRRFEAPGVVCPQCGWIGRSGATCPFDEHRTEQRRDVVESAIDAALEQSADVVVLRHSNCDSADGPVAAVLRFPR